jgi:hypothetical protein
MSSILWTLTCQDAPTLTRSTRSGEGSSNLSKTWQLAKCVPSSHLEQARRPTIILMHVPCRKRDDSQSITWFRAPSRFVWRKEKRFLIPTMCPSEQLLSSKPCSCPAKRAVEPRQQNYSDACSGTAPETGRILMEVNWWGSSIRKQMQRGPGYSIPILKAIQVKSMSKGNKLHKLLT